MRALIPKLSTSRHTGYPHALIEALAFSEVGRVIAICAIAEAVIWSRRSIEANPNWPLSHLFLAAALALLGSLDEARAAARVGLAFDPGFTIRRFRDGASSDNPVFLARRERFYEGLRMAGVPEG